MNLTEILFIMYVMVAFGATIEEHHINKSNYKGMHWISVVAMKLFNFITLLLALPIIVGQIIIREYLK